MGIVRGKSYNKGSSFSCQLSQNGGASSTTAANPPNGGAKAWSVGKTLYYVTQVDWTGNVNYPVAICGTSGAPWTDGWYRPDIFPWATYTITYDAKEGTCSTKSDTKTCNTALSLPTPSRSNATANGHKVTYNQNGWPNAIAASQATNTIKYDFANWNTKSDGSGTAYTTSFNDSVAALGVAAPSNTTLYAQYSGTTTKGSVTLANPSASGYVFKSWNTKADGSGSSYSAGRTITPSSDMTLYAIWDYDQATAYVKSSGAWTKGKVYYKENGTWVKAKKIYTKVNGTWVEGKA